MRVTREPYRNIRQKPPHRAAMTEPFSKRAIGKQRLQLRDDPTSNDDTAPGPRRQHRVGNHRPQNAKHGQRCLARWPVARHGSLADFGRGQLRAGLQPVDIFKAGSTDKILCRDMRNLRLACPHQRHFGLVLRRHADMAALALDRHTAVTCGDQRRHA